MFEVERSDDMRLLSFRVTKFRNIVDSGVIEVDQSVTCLVGKNEAGKSALIEALYHFSPAYGERFDVEDQYPRWLVVRDRKAGDLNAHIPITVEFSLEPEDKAAVNDLLGTGTVKGDVIRVGRNYGGGERWVLDWSEKAAAANLMGAIPAAIASLLEGVESLDQVREGLDGLVLDDDDGPTAEDLKTAKAVIRDRGLDEHSVWERVVEILGNRIPRFFRFTSYSTLPGRIDFRELVDNDEDGPAQDELQTARALLTLAGTDIEQLGNEEYELRKGELEAVQIDLTRQVFEYWKQNPDLEVSIDVDKETVTQAGNTTAVARYLDIRLRDKRTGYSNNFSQRSSGFQWFFSFLAAFSEFDDEDTPIVLLDEPALNLHGKAQADFLRFINERLAPTSPVIYTTHSPFMVETDKLGRVRIIEDNGPPDGAISRDDVLGADPDSLFPLQAALGYDIAQNLFVGPHNLVVEGTSDFIYLTVMSSACNSTARTGLDDRWRMLPAGGATNIPTFVSLIGPHLAITVLADSDTKGMQRITNMIDRQLLSGHRLILVSVATASDHADIEDLFSEGDYLKLYNKTFNASIKVSDLPPGDRIVKRVESYIGDEFRHGEVAETLLRHQVSFTDSTLDRFSVIMEAINNTLGT
jgi:predicted ATPase